MTPYIEPRSIYEEVTCLGFNPDTNVLEAVVQVKQATGCDGSLCQTGSFEYVRFFVDYGSGWEDAGPVAINVRHSRRSGLPQEPGRPRPSFSEVDCGERERTGEAVLPPEELEQALQISYSIAGPWSAIAGTTDDLVRNTWRSGRTGTTPCEYTCLGTVGVQVHDIASIPGWAGVRQRIDFWL